MLRAVDLHRSSLSFLLEPLWRSLRHNISGSLLALRCGITKSNTVYPSIRPFRWADWLTEDGAQVSTSAQIWWRWLWLCVPWRPSVYANRSWPPPPTTRPYQIINTERGRWPRVLVLIHAWLADNPPQQINGSLWRIPRSHRAILCYFRDRQNPDNPRGHEHDMFMYI